MAMLGQKPMEIGLALLMARFAETKEAGQWHGITKMESQGALLPHVP
jgi:hypothetical protein